MAKKGKGKKRRSSPKGINIKNAIFAYANLAVATRAVTNVSPIQFFTEGYVGDQSMAYSGAHGSKITLKEILSGGQLKLGLGDNEIGTVISRDYSAGSLGQTAMDNLKQNAFPAVGALIGLKFAEIAIDKLGVKKSFNSLSRSLKLNKTVRM